MPVSRHPLGTSCLALLIIPFQGCTPLHLVLKKAYGRIDALYDRPQVRHVDCHGLRAALFVVAPAEFETLYLSGGCFRKLGKEFYPMRAFEDRQAAKHKFL